VWSGSVKWGQKEMPPMTLQQFVSDPHLRWLDDVIRMQENRPAREAQSWEWTYGRPRTTWRHRYGRRSAYGPQPGRHGRQGDQQKRVEELDCFMCFARDGLRSKVRMIDVNCCNRNIKLDKKNCWISAEASWGIDLDQQLCRPGYNTDLWNWPSHSIKSVYIWITS